jgi:hypothetical protein
VRWLVLGIAWCLTTSASTQNSQITVQTSTPENSKVWQIAGTCNLPENSFIELCLMWRQHQVAGSKKTVRVQSGVFQYRLSPVSGRIPSGTYQLLVSWDPRMQTTESAQRLPAFSQKLALRVGGEFDGVRELRQWQKWLRGWLQDMQRWHEDLSAQAKQYLSSQQSDAKTVAIWWQTITGDYQKLQDRLAPWQPPALLVPYSWDDVRDSHSLLGSSKAVLTHYRAVINRKYQSSAATTDDVSMEEQPALEVCQKNVAKRIERLRARLPQPNAGFLEQDLLWCNELFKAVNSQHAAMAKDFEREQWDEFALGIRQELSDFKSRAAEYNGSPMADQYKELIPGLAVLHDCLLKLATVYSADLYRQNGLPHNESGGGNPGEIVKKLQTQFVELYKIVQEYQEQRKNNLEQKRKQISELVAEADAFAQQWQKEIEAAVIKPLTSEQIRNWQQKNRQTAIGWRQKVKTWQNEAKSSQKLGEALSIAEHIAMQAESLTLVATPLLQGDKSLEASVAWRERRRALNISLQAFKKISAK